MVVIQSFVFAYWPTYKHTFFINDTNRPRLLQLASDSSSERKKDGLDDYAFLQDEGNVVIIVY